MSSKILEYFEHLENSGKLGHAFLIGNTYFDNIKEDIEKIINIYFFKNEQLINENRDIYIIEPDKSMITKDQILDLQNNLKTTSLENDIKLYIIKEAEKMNLYASNSLLKILEEPEKNIYAILISSNVDKVLPTIKSRCQIVYTNHQACDNSIYNEITEEELIKILNFIKSTDKLKEKSIVYNTESFKDRNETLKSFKIIEKFYLDCLNSLYNKNLEYFINDEESIKEINKNNDVKNIVAKLSLINRTINSLEYNVNLNLLLDKYYIGLGRC